MFILGLLLIFCDFAYSQNIHRDGPNWYNTQYPIPVMHLEGSIEEMAIAHAKFALQNPNGKETLEYFADLPYRYFIHNPSLKNRLVLRKLTEWFYKFVIRKRMLEHVPAVYYGAYKSFAQTLQISEEKIWDGLFIPDIALNGSSLVFGHEQAPILPLSFGCTSIIWNSRAASVLHGRNLDYEGVGYWDQNQVLIHFVPQDGLAHVAVAALGMHASGITAFNETGLTLAIHQLNLDDTQVSATPVVIVSAEVMRQAHNINDAIQIIKSFPRSAGWAYIVSQGQDRAVIETSAHHVEIRRSSTPFFYQTNHVSSEELRKKEIFYTPGGWLDTFERAQTLEQYAKIKGNKELASVQKMANLLGNHSRVAGGTLAKLENIQSVIFDANHKRLWIAKGSSSKAPNEGKFIEYRWSHLRSALPPIVSDYEVETSLVKDLGKEKIRLRGLLRKAYNKRLIAHPEKREALLIEYVKNFKEFSKNKKINLEGSWPGFYFYVWDFLRKTPIQNPEHLLEILELALKDPDLHKDNLYSKHRFSLGKLFHGRLFDLLNHREKAKVEYQKAIESASFERLKKAAIKNLNSPYTWEDTKKIAVEWGMVDLFQY